MSAPDTFDELRIAFHDNYETLSPQLQRIARTALEDPNTFALETIVNIAKKAEAQPSSLVRFAKAFGYSGFSDMQKVFRLRLIEGVPANRGRIYDQHEKLEEAAQDDPLSILKELSETSIDSLTWLQEDTTAEALKAAMELLAKARQIYVLGQRRAFPVASYISYALTRMETPCHLLDFVGGMAPQQAALMTADDLLIAVSFAPYSPAVVEIVKETHIRGTPILTITDTLSSPLSRYCSHYFTVRESNSHRFRPLTGSMVLAQAIVAAFAYYRDADPA